MRLLNSKRSTSRILVAVISAGALVGGMAGPATAGQPAPAASAPVTPPAATPAASPTEKVIVLLRDQIATLPATTAHSTSRSADAHSDQQSVLARLAGPAPKNVKQFSLANAFAATVSSAQAAALAADPAVASVEPDANISLAPATEAGSATSVTPKAAQPGIVNAPAPANDCSTNPAKPSLEPEALAAMNVRSDDPTAKTAAALGIDGSGVTVGFIADGINPDNAGFLRKNRTSAIVDYQDFSGDGPTAPSDGGEAFGDASSIGAQGNVVYDVATFGNPGAVSYPGGHCYIRIVGVSPGAKVVALKAFGALTTTSAFLQAIDYAVTVKHVDVLNESFGSNPYPDSGSRIAIELFNDQAVAAGVTVTASSGDAGPTSTIGSPATDPKVISTGATTITRLYAQINYAAADTFGNGKYQSNNVSVFSSSGVSNAGRTIDVSAPGDSGWAVCDDSGNFGDCTNFAGSYSPFEFFGGTSEAAPLTAGTAALVIQAYRKTHAGISPTPAVVKQLITGTAHDLGLPGVEQGSGLVDARAAVEAAFTYPGATTAAPASASSNIAVSTDQMTLVGAPGTIKTSTFTVQNVGNKKLTVLPSTRKYVTLSNLVQNGVLDPTGSHIIPYPTTGLPADYTILHFTVPTGADRLVTSFAYQSGVTPGGAGPLARYSVFAPDGTFEGANNPQGSENYSTVDVRSPVAGVWSAVVFAKVTGGYAGAFTFRSQTQRAVPVGTLSTGVFTLNPGQKRAVQVSLPMPSSGGDTSYTVGLDTSTGHQTAIPVIMRALIPVVNGNGPFHGTITGGNGRGGAPAQTFTYSFDVPKGLRDLDVSVAMARDPGDLLEGILVDPAGEQPSVSGNIASDGTQGLSMANAVANPAPGRWRYIIAVQNPVTGAELQQAFTGLVRFNGQRVAATGVPTSAGTKLTAGHSYQAQITVKNTSAAPIGVQTDARTSKNVLLQLAPFFAGATVTLSSPALFPYYLVPPDTGKFVLSASSTVPAQVELQSPAGGIDLLGDLQQAQAGSTLSTATVSEESPERVGQGLWGSSVEEIGPFGVNGAPTGSTTLVGNAVTKGFDKAVSTSTGDPFLVSVDPTADTGTPLLIEPGQTATIAVTIKPTAAKGSVVSGVINLVSPPLGDLVFNTTGDVLSALPYTYTVG